MKPEQRAALQRHGYDPDALPCGAIYTPLWPLADSYLPGTMLRSHVCELDGILIDGHEGSDLDYASTRCIQCGDEGDNPNGD